MHTKTQKLVILAMMSALAFVLASMPRVPLVSLPPLTLRYDPKDVIIIISGFIFGPMAAFIVTVVVSLLQFISVSLTGYIGLIMNITSGTAFCCTAAFIYKKKRTISGAIIGLAVGVVFATAVMMLMNWLVVPIFVERVSREEAARLLVPLFMPFNLISNSLNAALTLLTYKHVKTALQSARLIPMSDDAGHKGLNRGIIVMSAFVILVCVIWVLFNLGVIPPLFS